MILFDVIKKKLTNFVLATLCEVVVWLYFGFDKYDVRKLLQKRITLTTR